MPPAPEALRLNLPARPDEPEVREYYESQLAENGDDGYESTAYASCLLYTSPSPRDLSTSRMPSSA